MIAEDGMKRSFLFQLIGIITLICLTLSLGGTSPVSAEYIDPLASAANSANADLPRQIELTFAGMGMTSPQTLAGPLSEYALRFNLPAGWSPTGLAVINLELSAFFSSIVPTEGTEPISGLTGGDLSVFLNGTLVAVKTLQQSGDQTIQLEFDSSLLTLPARGSSNELRVRWDGSVSCRMNLLSSVTIMPSSTLDFSYAESSRPLSLNHFPVPFIIENSLQPVSLKLILPASPSGSELRAALIVAAGIGQLSGGAAAFEMVSLEDFKRTSAEKQNVILVATSEKLKTPELRALGLPAELQAGQAEGIVHLFQHSTGEYGVFVSGDEAGIIKAAQVVSANQVISAGEAVTMIVSAVNPAVSSTNQENMTLQDLGVGEMVFTHPDGLVQSVDFFIPAGEQARPDSTFDLVISHSQQLDYLRSGLQVKLNGFPAVSLRLNDNTANQILFRLILPSNLIHAGRNTVELIAGLNTRDICTPPVESVAWLRVSASSLLHIPLERAVAGSPVSKVLGDFPDALMSGSGLDNVTFVLATSDFGNLQAAGKLANQLGAALPQSEPLRLHAVWYDMVDPALTAESNVILVGKPLDFKTLAEKGQFPALVFNQENTLSDESALAMVTKPAAGADVGYLAIRGFDIQTDRVLLAVLGNSPAGIRYAVDAVSNPEVSASNFVVVVGEGVQAGWLDQGISTGKVVLPAAQATEAPAASDAVQQFKQGMLVWVIPVVAALLALMILLVYIEVRQQIRKE
ncbi:MAG: hypothetical protein C0401_08900 [Anaerolinea sp.]|nr:hypothetical protein [Anaerolinea sp.]